MQSMNGAGGCEDGPLVRAGTALRAPIHAYTSPIPRVVPMSTSHAVRPAVPDLVLPPLVAEVLHPKMAKCGSRVIDIGDTKSAVVREQDVGAVPVALHPARHHLLGSSLPARDVLAHGTAAETSLSDAIDNGSAVEALVGEVAAGGHVARMKARRRPQAIVDRERSGRSEAAPLSAAATFEAALVRELDDAGLERLSFESPRVDSGWRKGLSTRRRPKAFGDELAASDQRGRPDCQYDGELQA